MKKLVTLLLLLSLTGCAPGVTGGIAKNAPSKEAAMFVDGVASGTAPVVVQDGETYVAWYSLATAANVDVQVKEGRVYVYRRPAVPKEPEISHGFAQAEDALRLLKEKAPDYYRLVIEEVELVVPGQYNQAFSRNNTVALADKQTTTYLAATLAHEAEHLKNAHTNQALAGNATEDERDAHRVSLAVLQAIGAPQSEIHQAEKYV